MYRHSPVRNPRSKGIKLKHVLQGFLLLVICFWLIFQVKRSYDKKKEFDVHDNKISLSTNTRGSGEIAKLGRKDIQPKIMETIKEKEIHEDTQEDEDEHEDEHEEEHEEHEDNKNEDEDQEEDKVEEEKDDGDEIDENELEKPDVEIDREEVDIIDEDKETEEKDSQSQSQSQTENEGSTVNHDEDGSTVHTNEAREENYKGDDASSAVTHNGRNLGTENENKNKTSDNNSSGDVGQVENGQTTENKTSSNVTMTQEKDYESIVTSLNATSSINSHDNGPPSGTTMMITEAQNVTVSVSDQLVSNATLTELRKGSSNSTNDTDDKSLDLSKTEDETNEGENLDTNNVTEVTEEILDPDGVELDAIDSTDPSHLEEKEVRTDLDTLPEIETEGSNSEDTAAE